MLMLSPRRKCMMLRPTTPRLPTKSSQVHNHCNIIRYPITVVGSIECSHTVISAAQTERLSEILRAAWISCRLRRSCTASTTSLEMVLELLLAIVRGLGRKSLHSTTIVSYSCLVFADKRQHFKWRPLLKEMAPAGGVGLQHGVSIHPIPRSLAEKAWLIG